MNHQGHVFTMLHNMAALQAFCKHIGSVRKRVSRPLDLHRLCIFAVECERELVC